MSVVSTKLREALPIKPRVFGEDCGSVLGPLRRSDLGDASLDTARIRERFRLLLRDRMIGVGLCLDAIVNP
jgi:hypothetical protein